MKRNIRPPFTSVIAWNKPRKRRKSRKTRAKFVRERIAAPGKFDPRSYRVVTSDGHRVVIGCPKGQWSPKKQRCKVGTRAQAILHPIRKKALRRLRAAANPPQPHNPFTRKEARYWLRDGQLILMALRGAIERKSLRAGLYYWGQASQLYSILNQQSKAVRVINRNEINKFQRELDTLSRQLIRLSKSKNPAKWTIGRGPTERRLTEAEARRLISNPTLMTVLGNPRSKQAEIKELLRIAKTRTKDPKRQRAMVEAFLAGREKMLPAKRMRYSQNKKLTTAQRHKLPARVFGLPKKRKYPMPDRRHAANAKARAAAALKQGYLTRSEYNRIVRKANTILYGKAVPTKREMREARKVRRLRPAANPSILGEVAKGLAIDAGKSLFRKNPCRAMPREQFERRLSQSGTAQQKAEYRKALAAYNRFHRTLPRTISREMISDGRRGRTSSTFLYKVGQAPDSTYIPVAGSGKGKTPYVHDWKNRPDVYASPDGKTLIYKLKGKAKISDWMRG